jgi:hypothetical protein
MSFARTVFAIGLSEARLIFVFDIPSYLEYHEELKRPDKQSPALRARALRAVSEMEPRHIWKIADARAPFSVRVKSVSLSPFRMASRFVNAIYTRVGIGHRG